MSKNKNAISSIEGENEVKVDAAPIQENTQDNTSKKTKTEGTKKAAKADKATKPAKVAKEDKKAKEAKAAKAPKETKASKTLVPEVFVQLANNEIAVSPVIDQVKAEWVAAGHKESSIKTLNLYVKPEESAAYYVINEKHTGKVDL